MSSSTRPELSTSTFGKASELTFGSSVGESTAADNAVDNANVAEALPSGLNVSLNRFKSDFSQLQRIGRGGFGAVFRVRELMSDNIYAIKKVPVSSARSWRPRLQRVREEVKILARLNHKNCVRYHAAWLERMDPLENSQEEMMAGFSEMPSMSESSSDMSSVRDESIRQVVTMNKPTIDMCLFIQMEYCPFGSLREYLVRPKREVNVMKMLRVLHQIADALEYLHLQNYIHR